MEWTWKLLMCHRCLSNTFSFTTYFLFCQWCIPVCYFQVENFLVASLENDFWFSVSTIVQCESDTLKIVQIRRLLYLPMKSLQTLQTLSFLPLSMKAGSSKSKSCGSGAPWGFWLMFSCLSGWQESTSGPVRSLQPASTITLADSRSMTAIATAKILPHPNVSENGHVKCTFTSFALIGWPQRMRWGRPMVTSITTSALPVPMELPTVSV